MPTEERSITELLRRWRGGERAAEQQLVEEVYSYLRHIADLQLARSHGTLTLRPTEIVHESFARLRSVRAVEYVDRSHFFAVCAKIMRRVIVDSFRAKGAARRGGGLPFVVFSDEHVAAAPRDPVDWLLVDRALRSLEAVDASSAQVVELKFFSGLTTDEIADVLGVSEATVRRRWRFARAWLARKLDADGTTVLA